MVEHFKNLRGDLIKSLFLWILFAIGAHAHANPVQVQKSDWNGFEKESFSVSGHPAYVVIPKIAAPGKPWIWRTSFPDYQPVVDLALVANGWHIGYVEVLDLEGADSALDLMDQFYAQVRTQWGLAEKMAVEPCSRGGLPAYRYAARHPERIACIYGDVPVMDFKSWPYGRPQDRVTDWPKVLKAYGFRDDAEAMRYPYNPIDTLAPIAKAKIPIRHVISLNDQVVPPEQNTLEAQRRLRKLGSDLQVVSVKSSNDFWGHHFPYPDVFGSVRFIMDHSYVLPVEHEYFKLRDGLANSFETFVKQRHGRVVFLGGSITFNPGWREEVIKYLQARFPQTQFDFVSTGIPSLGSVPHAFRLERDVLSHGPADLVFVEAAVNDHNYDLYPNRSELALRGMEGVVRHLRMANPMTDIVEMHFVDSGDMQSYHASVVPYTVAIHERVAEHYGCPSLDLSREVSDRIDAKEFTWSGDFRDIHPSPYGQLLYSNSITRLIDAAFNHLVGRVHPHLMPRVMDPLSYFNGRFGSITDATLVKGFELDPSWKPLDGKETRDGFVNVPALVGTSAGAESSFQFTGRGVGLMITSGPDAGIVESSVDGRPWVRLDTFTQWSKYLHLPWAIVLEDNLAAGPHLVRVRITPDHNPQSVGFTLRVQQLLLN